MKPDNHPKDKNRPVPTTRWWLILTTVILVGTTFLVLYNSYRPSSFSDENTEQNVLPQDGSVSGRNGVTDPVSPSETASLPVIVDAIEAGKIENLTVQGDFLTAITTEGNVITAQKESTISALETLKLLGASEEALADLPISVEGLRPRSNTLNTWLVTAGIGSNWASALSRRSTEAGRRQSWD